MRPLPPVLVAAPVAEARRAPPLVSVVVTAYEQEAFVGEALASVLAQRTEVPFEVVVGVDASRDGTAEVVREFERERPEIVRGIYQDARVGMFRNFVATFSAARGELVALLEGDDRWTEPDKLAKQVAALEARPEAVLCAHAVEMVALDGRWLGTVPETPWAEGPSRHEFVARLCDVHTSSLLFRNVFAGGLPVHVRDESKRVFDLALKLALAARGEIVYLPEAMSVFRRVPGSASSAIDGEGWRDVILRSLAGVRPEMDDDLRRVVDRQLVELLVGGALCAQRPHVQRLAMAARALRRRPRAAARGLARGVYSGLPEEAKRIYRSSRALWSGTPESRRQ